MVPERQMGSRSSFLLRSSCGVRDMERKGYGSHEREREIEREEQGQCEEQGQLTFRERERERR
jgi:hypothetical protein